MRTSIATVSLSGSLEDKLAAAASAGFDGVEIFEPDLVASPLSPARVREAAAGLGLSIDLYQPFRDFEGVGPERAGGQPAPGAAQVRAHGRAGRGHDAGLLQRGARTPSTTPSCRRPSCTGWPRRRSEHGVRIAFEALAWGRHISDYRDAWAWWSARTIPRWAPAWTPSTSSRAAATRPRSSGSPGTRSSSCSWPTRPCWAWTCSSGAATTAASRARAASTWPPSWATCRPRATTGRGRWRSSTTTSARPSPSGSPSTPAARCWRWPSRWAPPPCRPRRAPSGFAFAELAVGPDSGDRRGRGAGGHGLRPRGPAPVQAGAPVAPGRRARAAQPRRRPRRRRRAWCRRWAWRAPTPTAPPPAPRTGRRAAARAAAARARPTWPPSPRPTTPPCCSAGRPQAQDLWVGDFVDLEGHPEGEDCGITGVDHIVLSQPFDYFDEAVLFYRSVLGLEPRSAQDVAAPARAAQLARARGGGRPAAPGHHRAAAGRRRRQARRAPARGLRRRRRPRAAHRMRRARRAAAGGARQLLRRPRGPHGPGARAHRARCAPPACSTTPTGRAASSCSCSRR